MVAGTALLSALILVVWFPATALLHQRAAINASAAELSHLQHQDQALAQEQQALQSPAEIARLARDRFGLVNPGQQAYQVLPPAGKSGLASYAGDPGNQPVVSPSSSAELPPGSGATASSGSSGTPAPHASSGGTGGGGTGGQSSQPAASGHPSSPPGFLGRIGRTLEFWR